MVNNENVKKLKDLYPEIKEKILDIITYQMQDKIDESTMRIESTDIPVRNIAIKMWDDIRRNAINKFVFEDHKMFESQASFLLNREKFIESIFAHMLEDQNFCNQFVDIIMHELGEIGARKKEEVWRINPDLL